MELKISMERRRRKNKGRKRRKRKRRRRRRRRRKMQNSWKKQRTQSEGWDYCGAEVADSAKWMDDQSGEGSGDWENDQMSLGERKYGERRRKRREDEKESKEVIDGREE